MTGSGPVPAVLTLAGRNGLPFARLHKVPLYLHALRALATAGQDDVLVVVDEADVQRVVTDVRRSGLAADVRAGDQWWADLRSRDSAAGLLVHDALCPLTSSDFIRDVRSRALAPSARSVLAYRPVTDTVKTVVDSRIHGTINREGLAALVSPVVVAPAVLASALADDVPPPVDDFGRLADWLRARGEVELVRAPSLARRVDDVSSVNLLECVDELSRSVRREPADRPVALNDAAGPGAR